MRGAKGDSAVRPEIARTGAFEELKQPGRSRGGGLQKKIDCGVVNIPLIGQELRL